MNSGDPNADREPIAAFATTHWSVVLGAGHNPDGAADESLAELCRSYWYPLYAYVRRRVKDVGEAQDLTQEFFARLLEKNLLAHAAPERGRFRSFLLTAMKNFLTNEWNKAHAKKRGGGRAPLSLDFHLGESRYGLDPGHDLTPERVYERKWALTLLDRVLDRLQTEHHEAGKLELFNALRPLIAGDPPEGAYGQIAKTLEMSEGAVKVAVHRFRKRYRDLLRDELAETLANRADVDDEINWLFEVLS